MNLAAPAYERADRERRRSWWEAYLAERRGTYDFRARRYRAVAGELFKLDLGDGMIVVDVGAGMCEFDRYLREAGWAGRYVPVDGAIDGTELESWEPAVSCDFFVAIEVIEHLHRPWRLLRAFEQNASRGAVVTTPNAEVVDVLAIDPTHRVAVPIGFFEERGWEVSTHQFFHAPDDTILATWRAS